MGPKGSKQSKKKNNAKKQKNAQIEEELEMEKEEVRNQVKILVLGTGESGKSTFIKQLLILHKGGFTHTDRETYYSTIRKNTIFHIIQMINACKSFGWELEKKNLELARKYANIKVNEITDLNEKVVKELKQLWSDSALKTAYKNRHKFHLPDSSNYYLDDLDRIGETDYSPNDKDILLCRIPTTGLNKISFNFGETPWNVIDVGGQRSERRKWIHQFDDVTLIIYVVAINEFNQKLFEDEEVNRLLESLVLFEKTSNDKYFKEKNCVIFFNKIDLFEDKIKSEDLSQCFPDYEGGNDPDEAKKFIKLKFLEAGENESRNIFCHYTCATDTRNIENVFDAVNVSIIENTLKTGGYM
ncbi:guanine nucleotide-binding protein g(o) subunit alpha [Anaeramoeba flamelloides]|uniref:Guanine nucleotide-binding protein g(O) subunit alpha n=1 Tax=Anaeramoeba flamelloides TaxID=1746091 RepID=A0AAV7ZYR8_9EUKA|nr:guanine nucleotide-binding protein g(o) subunit alpha [Anaeramoeba flamelloides]KAJ6233359.1 guanine nucleotide-binding protein g(o) subunit alpha [Anaeramoeba flamelloides]